METRKTTFFCRWTFACLSGIKSFCWIVSFKRAYWSTPFALFFLCRIMFEWTFPPFKHERFYIQDRQPLPLSSAPFEEYAVALDRSFWEINKICCCGSKMSLTIILTCCLLLGSFFRTMSDWYNVKAFFMNVDFLSCLSYSFSRPPSSKSLLKTCSVSSQTWLDILRFFVVEFDNKQKSLKIIVCSWILLMEKNKNTWVSSKKQILLLNSIGIIWKIPFAIFESRVSNSMWCLSKMNPEWFTSSIVDGKTI